MISRGPVTHLISPKMTRREDTMVRRPYRCAVGAMIKTDEVSEQLYASSTLHDTRLHIRGDDSRRHQGWGTVMSRHRAGSGPRGGLTEVAAGPSARVAVVRHGPWHTYIAHRPYHSATAVSPPSSPPPGPRCGVGATHRPGTPDRPLGMSPRACPRAPRPGHRGQSGGGTGSHEQQDAGQETQSAGTHGACLTVVNQRQGHRPLW
jgi:hypothetical protein